MTVKTYSGFLALLSFVASLCLTHATWGAENANEARTASYFSSIADQPGLRRIFLMQMPKGGDLHNHLDGNTYAESLIRWAAEDGICVKREPPSFAPPPCDETKGTVPASILDSDTTLYNALIDSISMRNFVPSREPGHDHFFNAFPRFAGILPERRQGDMIAEAVSRFARQNTFYIELMITPGTLFTAGASAASLAWDDDPARMQAKLDAAKLQKLVGDSRHFLDQAEARKNEVLKCGSSDEDLGCKVTVRYLAQVIRSFPREHVFAQIALASAFAKADARVAGINLVNWEDHPVIAKDYDEQMRTVGFFTNKGKDVNVTLHAGELALGLVPPEELRNHIRLAIEEAGARRIGHGVDIAYEDNAEALLHDMSARKIPVEIGLTSNDVILGVRGKDHPFPLYRRYGVPVTLATDDEGVSRIDLTHEYQRAAETYNLTYLDLKALARNALEYSFLKPDEKAQMLRKLESDFQKFEAKDWSSAAILH